MKIGDKIKVCDDYITKITAIKWSIKYKCNLIYFLNEDGATAYEIDSAVQLVKPGYDDKKYKEGTFRFKKCTVMVSIDNGKWHLSISKHNASPSYKEIKAARYYYVPNDVTMAQLFPPEEEFVNLQPYCHHLWQIDEDYE
jgi:hypothetical protein